MTEIVRRRYLADKSPTETLLFPVPPTQTRRSRRFHRRSAIRRHFTANLTQSQSQSHMLVSKLEPYAPDADSLSATKPPLLPWARSRRRSISSDLSDSEEDTTVTPRADGKPIYMVSDGTGWTAEHSVNAALSQFEHCLVDRGGPINTRLFSGVEDVDRLIKQAAKEGALVLYTLADPSMAESAKQACKLWGVPSTDILRPTIEAIAAHIGVAPSGIPRGAPGWNPLTEDYFKRIEAIEFSFKQDGTLPQNLNRAHIVLVGVSRTGKTPLSIYLAQEGYKRRFKLSERQGPRPWDSKVT